MESNDKLNENNIKNRTCYYFDDRIRIENFDLDNILIHEKSFKIKFVSNISYKILIDPEPLDTRFNKIDGFIREYDGARCYYLEVKNIIPFTTVLDIL